MVHTNMATVGSIAATPNAAELTLKSNTVAAKKAIAKRAKSESGEKRPTNAFYYFCQKTKPDLFRDHPNLQYGSAPGEINRMMGQRWKELSEDERKQWTQEYEEEKQRWNQPTVTHLSVNGTTVKNETQITENGASKQEQQNQRDDHAQSLKSLTPLKLTLKTPTMAPGSNSVNGVHDSQGNETPLSSVPDTDVDMD